MCTCYVLRDLLYYVIEVVGGAGVPHGGPCVAVEAIFQCKTEEVATFVGQGYLVIALQQVGFQVIF